MGAFLVILWFGGIPNFELLIFGFIESLNFKLFLSDVEFLRRALIAHAAAAADRSSPRLSVDSMSGVDYSVSQGLVLCWNTHSLCGLGFRQVACPIGGVTCGAWFA